MTAGTALSDGLWVVDEKRLLTAIDLVIPVYNEEPHLAEVLEYLTSAPCPVPREWIIVDDCSTDRSGEVLRELQPQYGYRLFQQDRNAGKGAAVLHDSSTVPSRHMAIENHAGQGCQCIVLANAG
jgi:cellulose synthase/poly-beta-1,6-N-acetylglucosamine synthase-like glycosyltransferase